MEGDRHVDLLPYADEHLVCSVAPHPLAVSVHEVGQPPQRRAGPRARQAPARRAALPDNPRNHFQVDPAKFDFYAMDCYRAVGEDSLAMAMAEAVASTSTTPGGEVISPMRLSEAELTRATVLARNGEVASSTSAAEIGLDRNHRSLPSLLMVGNEVAHELRRLHPKSQSAIDFQHHIQLLSQPYLSE